MWWQHPDGATNGLPEGIGLDDIPMYGSEKVIGIPITKYLVVVEGEKAADALRAGGVPALATATGSSVVPTVAMLVRIAYAAKFLLWPDNDDAGRAHMQALAQRLYQAGARDVRMIKYEPADETLRWPEKADAADLVTPTTATAVLADLFAAWTVTVSRRAAATPREPKKGRQRDRGSVSDALATAFGIERAGPKKSVKCPMHDDKAASLWILPDDLRAICFAACSWSSPGVTALDIKAAAGLGL
jgi:DNA primase